MAALPQLHLSLLMSILTLTTLAAPPDLLALSGVALPANPLPEDLPLLLELVRVGLETCRALTPLLSPPTPMRTVAEIAASVAVLRLLCNSALLAQVRTSAADILRASEAARAEDPHPHRAALSLAPNRPLGLAKHLLVIAVS